MKDNKIDIMQNKIGGIITELHNITQEGEWAPLDTIEKAMRQLMYDLELLRKCTLDDPDFKWDDKTSHGYTQAKSEAFRNE